MLLRGELGEGAEAGAALCWQKLSDLMVMEGRSFRNAGTWLQIAGPANAPPAHHLPSKSQLQDVLHCAGASPAQTSRYLFWNNVARPWPWI